MGAGHARKVNHMLEMWDLEPQDILTGCFVGRRRGLKLESQAVIQ